jgi:LPPG:FO 2-phospho-L-lactate transferase
MLRSLGHEVTALGVARLYEGLVDRYALDEADAELGPALAELGMARAIGPTVMTTDAERAGLARFLLEAAAR